MARQRSVAIKFQARPPNLPSSHCLFLASFVLLITDIKVLLLLLQKRNIFSLGTRSGGENARQFSYRPQMCIEVSINPKPETWSLISVWSRFQSHRDTQQCRVGSMETRRNNSHVNHAWISPVNRKLIEPRHKKTLKNSRDTIIFFLMNCIMLNCIYADFNKSLIFGCKKMRIASEASKKIFEH
jgi:hypothetical protein